MKHCLLFSSQSIKDGLTVLERMKLFELTSTQKIWERMKENVCVRKCVCVWERGILVYYVG